MYPDLETNDIIDMPVILLAVKLIVNL